MKLFRNLSVGARLWVGVIAIIVALFVVVATAGARSASLNGMRGGQPSSTAPSAGPWLSPQVVMRKTRPKVFQLMWGIWRTFGRLSNPVARRNFWFAPRRQGAKSPL